jgi:(2R)-3-sulfolactate dehydrogenase (NADP+)
MTEQSKVLTLAEVDDLARRALAGCGAHGHQLELAVQSVVDAECDGIRTVGLGYLPLYCGHLQVGKINHDARPSHAQIAPSALRAHADSGFAHAAFAASESDFYALARSQGISALSMPSAVAPAPGAQPFFGTNPMAFAIPRLDQAPIIADMATSQVALVTIKKAAAEGRPIPVGWGYDKDGNDTTDAAAVINGGALAPAGGYKGMLLGLLVDLLAFARRCFKRSALFVSGAGFQE